MRPESKLENIKQGLWSPTDEAMYAYNFVDQDEFYRPWGFVIYRTSYEPAEATDRQWKTLLAKIPAQIGPEIDVKKVDEDDEPLAALLKKRFFLEPQSDATVFDGKTMEDIRVTHLARSRADSRPPNRRGIVKTHTWPGEIFLLADAEVLEGVDKDSYSWVKCVWAEHDEHLKANPLPEKRRMPHPDPKGWFYMTTRSIVDLCVGLADCDWSNLPPPAFGDRGGIWQGDFCGMDPAQNES